MTAPEGRSRTCLDCGGVGSGCACGKELMGRTRTACTGWEDDESPKPTCFPTGCERLDREGSCPGTRQLPPETLRLNGHPVTLSVRPDIEHRGVCEIGYDYTLHCFVRDPDDPDVDRIVLHELLHALLDTDPQRVCSRNDERHEQFVGMLTAGLFDVLGYRRAAVSDDASDRTPEASA